MGGDPPGVSAEMSAMGKILRRLLPVSAAGVLLRSGGTLCGRDTGAQASIEGFALPQYRKGDNRLQFILYGKSASNLGALMVLKELRLDIIRDKVKSVNEIISMDQAEIYPLGSPTALIREYWKDKGHSMALLYTPCGIYDKNSKTLRGEDKVRFRSRELDIDGVGFDAFYDRRFIHIRSEVRVVIRPEARDRSMQERKRRPATVKKPEEGKEPETVKKPEKGTESESAKKPEDKMKETDETKSNTGEEKK